MVAQPRGRGTSAAALPTTRSTVVANAEAIQRRAASTQRSREIAPPRREEAGAARRTAHGAGRTRLRRALGLRFVSAAATTAPISNTSGLRQKSSAVRDPSRVSACDNLRGTHRAGYAAPRRCQPNQLLTAGSRRRYVALHLARHVHGLRRRSASRSISCVKVTTTARRRCATPARLRFATSTRSSAVARYQPCTRRPTPKTYAIWPRTGGELLREMNVRWRLRRGLDRDKPQRRR